MTDLSNASISASRTDGALVPSGAALPPPAAAAAIWFDGTTSRRRAVQLWRAGDDVCLANNEAGHDAAGLIAQAHVGEVRVGSRIGNAPYPLSFPAGGLAFCADHAAIEQMFGLDRAQHWVSRMERAGSVVAVALVGLIAALWFAYQALIPKAAEFAATRIPRETEQHLGELTMKAIDRAGFKSSRLDEPWRQRIRADFAQLAAAAGLDGRVDIQFRQHSMMNAFALPGGHVVLTDPLVRALKDDHEALLAVLAHELGHQAHRDTLRHLISGSLSAVLIGAVTGDVSGVAALSTAIPSIAQTLKFSRTVEAEADDYAFALLQRTGHSAAAFARAMERMRASQLCKMLRAQDRADARRSPGPTHDSNVDDPESLSPSSTTPARPPARCNSDPAAYLNGRDADVAKLNLQGGLLSYVSTHPATEDRINRARSAAR